MNAHKIERLTKAQLTKAQLKTKKNGYCMKVEYHSPTGGYVVEVSKRLHTNHISQHQTFSVVFTTLEQAKELALFVFHRMEHAKYEYLDNIIAEGVPDV